MLNATLNKHGLNKKISPTDLYQHFSKNFGYKNVFLLETLQEQNKEDNNSIIGVNRLLEIYVKDNIITFNGMLNILNEFYSFLKTIGYQLDNDNQLKFTSHEEIWDFLPRIHKFCDNLYNPESNFNGGFLASFTYDLALKIEQIEINKNMKKPIDVADISLILFQAVIIIEKQKSILYTINSPELGLSPDKVISSLNEYEELDNSNKQTSNEFPSCKVQVTMEKEKFLEIAQKYKKHIIDGDIYQIQLGYEILIESDISPIEVYQNLMKNNPSPYMYIAPIANSIFIGASPELFLKLENNTLKMKPIAGTIGRGQTPEDDQKRIVQLQNDIKEQAEHIMLVDLCRNDIGKICVPSTLKVTDLMAIEKYSHVFHMVSDTYGELQAKYNLYDAIKATFPAGTMTGAPKIRAMELIEEQELTRRGIYAGAIGVISFNGKYMNTGLCIRSTLYNPQTKVYSIRASAGIVYDSVLEYEWKEIKHKMSSTYQAITGKDLKSESFIN